MRDCRRYTRRGSVLYCDFPLGRSIRIRAVSRDQFPSLSPHFMSPAASILRQPRVLSAFPSPRRRWRHPQLDSIHPPTRSPRRRALSSMSSRVRLPRATYRDRSSSVPCLAFSNFGQRVCVPRGCLLCVWFLCAYTLVHNGPRRTTQTQCLVRRGERCLLHFPPIYAATSLAESSIRFSRAPLAVQCRTRYKEKARRKG